MAGALQLTGICSVAVQVRDLDRSLAFYCGVPGLRLGQREGWIAQLHGQGDAPPALVLLEAGGRAVRHAAAPGPTAGSSSGPGSRLPGTARPSRFL